LDMPEAVGRWLMVAAGQAVSGQNTHQG
jgi:hypothetical protein